MSNHYLLWGPYIFYEDYYICLINSYYSGVAAYIASSNILSSPFGNYFNYSSVVVALPFGYNILYN